MLEKVNKMKIYLAVLLLSLLTSCDSISEPLESVTYSGKGQYTNERNNNLQQKIIDICNLRNCSRTQIRAKHSDMEFSLDLHITNNDDLNIFMFKNNTSYVGFFQKDMAKPSIKTILVLRDLKDLGFDIKYIGGEKWHCDGKPLKKRYCRQETTQGHGQYFLDYIVQDNNMKFEYKDGDKTIQL